MHESNILKIKTETEKIVYEILESSKKINFTEKDENIKTMENELLKLKNEEFIISMVGTMKAGKSTTINAIVGQEILPSRVEAMTTLPTLITHIKGKVEPVLKLNKSYINTLNDLLRKVRNNSKSKNYSKSEQNITNNKNFQFKEQILGNEKIKEALTIFNDLRRVSKDQIFDKFIELENIPRIEIEFKTLKDIVTKDNSKLSLLDTPGPNEYKQSAKLKETLKIQLENSSAVIFVVDYKSYESGDTNDIKQRISDIHEYLKSENFYILANKFDANKNSDEEYENTKKIIYTYFELKDKIELKNIFPVSSEWAFQSYLVNELILKDKINKSLPNTKNFWKDFLGELWEEDIEDIERVKKICKIKYKNSYFQKVIDNIIKDVYENAMFRVLEKTMIVIDASKIITKMGDGFKVRLNSVNDTTNIEVLNNKIELLKKDIDKIKKVEEDFKNISENNFYLEFDGIEKSINNKLKSLDNIKEFPKKKFEYKEEAQKEVKEKIQNIEQLKNNITSEFINKGEEIVKKYIEEINSKLRGDFEKIIDDIKNQLGKEIRVYSPNLDKSSYNIVTFSYTDNLVKTIDKEYWGSGFFRLIDIGDLEWGKETIINEEEVYNVVNNFKNSIYTFIRNNKESNFKNIKNEISKSINILKESIQIYTKDMENIQKESKNEEFDLNRKVNKIEMELDYINGLEKRIETIKKEISKEK